QGFKVRLGQQAGQLYEQLYGKKRSRKVRTHLMAQTSRNMVRTYPCGILEQAYRTLVREGSVATGEGAVQYPVASEADGHPGGPADGDGAIPAATTMKMEPSPQNGP